MQDNAPSIKLKNLLIFFKEMTMMCLTVLHAQTSDLNPLENIRWTIEKALSDISLSSDAYNLFTKIKEVWDNYPIQELFKYISSMPRSMEAVIKAKGCHTKYRSFTCLQCCVYISLGYVILSSVIIWQ